MSDEAQAETPPPSPKPLKPRIAEFGIKVSVGVSVEVDGKDWVKLGAEGHTNWTNGLPTNDDIRAAARYLQMTHLEPCIEEMLVHMANQKIEQRAKTS